MRVFCSIVHILMLGNLVNEEPDGDSAENAFPHGLGNVVPHLCIDSVQLLHAAHVALGCRCKCNGPHTQVMHVL